MAVINPIKPQNLAFENLWQKNAAHLAPEIVTIWKQFNPGLEEAKADERLNQIVYVVKNEFGQVVGISTAFKAYIKQLRNHLYAFRLIILPEYRIPGMSSKLTVMTRDFLESIYKSDERDRCIGIVTLVENEELKKTRNEAVWKASGLTYIGNSGNGSHIRVYYFKDAVIA